MKALILNSGMGKRMGTLTREHPKCMTEIEGQETILSRQLKLLQQCGVTEVIITTGIFDEILIDYCNSLNLSLQYTFVKNPVYDKTNYIYSIYLARNHLDDDIVLMHGDLVFELGILKNILYHNYSCMTVSSTISLPQKDFKAVVKNSLIEKIGIEFFTNAVAAQPLYKLNKEDWTIWLNRIIDYCENGQVSCYAENAFNEVSNRCHIYPVDFSDRLCAEIDTPEDLALIKKKISE
ncbi:Choline kinase [Natronincola peptidivorans]|uniref:Choline kinase n=1 Tax=Natronincola peptidivorans TaxID=426128 RepID=A0A1I0CRG9_9FIRM|nr:NTP transferase domain-containing protein [Natronincola peptidivorans]SET21656.1 Choline kinase [Natronincola peptidivorans]